MKNKLIYTTTFKHLYKKKSKAPKFIIDKVNDAIRELSETNRPDNVGICKKGNLKGILAYELGNSNRLLYTINNLNGTKEVVLLKVCSHKDVYGKE